MLKLQAHEKEVEIITSEEFVRGSVGKTCQINLDEFWADYSNTIVFKRCGGKPINILINKLSNTLTIPFEVMAESGVFRIGVFGVAEGKVLPTLWSNEIKVRYGTDTHGTTPPTYIPSEIDQLRLSKQDKLTAGNGIKIENNVISSSGTIDYELLENKPQINGVELLGNKSLTDLGIDIPTKTSELENDSGFIDDTAFENYYTKTEVDEKTVVDQTYTPDSENAQSGKAVAEAVAIEQKRTDNTFANALKGNATGQVLSLPDISPNEHTLGVKVSSKNLWQNTNTTFPSALSYNSTNQTYILAAGTAGYNFVAHTLTNPIPVGTTVTISIMFQSGKGRSVAIGGYHRTGGKSWQGYIDVPSKVDMTGQTLTSTFTTTETVEEFMVFHNTGDNIEDPFIFRVQYELGSTATSYTPYISDLTSVTVTRYGTVETDSPQTYIPAADGTISGVKSLYPTTTLMTDTEEAIISAEYNRDINKAFAELQQAILSLGGNV